MADSDAPTRVIIQTDALTVTVEAPGARLATVKAHAEKLFRELQPDARRNVSGGGAGFCLERSYEG